MFCRLPAAAAAGGARRRSRCGATPSQPMAARAPDLPLCGRSAARVARYSFVTSRARARRRAPIPDGDFLFCVLPAAGRCCRRRSAPSIALRSYAVAADGRPGPRSAAMARAVVRAQEIRHVARFSLTSRARARRRAPIPDGDFNNKRKQGDC